MARIQYVFWDSDNTLVNTGVHHWRKHLEVLKTLGITLDEKWQKRIYENNGGQNWEWLSAELGLSMPKDEYLDLIDRWYYDHIHEMHIRPGILEALSFVEKSRFAAGGGIERAPALGHVGINRQGTGPAV